MSMHHDDTADKQTVRPNPLSELPLGSIAPRGWLRDQLEIQAQGLTGHLAEVWSDVGPNSGWLGGTGESWERGPYYVDGLLPLAYLLGDERLLTEAQTWVEWTLQSQTDEGQFGPAGNDDWWCRMIMLKVLIQYFEASADERVIPFMGRYFRYQLRHLPARPLTTWGRARGGENMLCAQWLHDRTGEPFLLDLIHMIHEQTTDWTDIFTDFTLWRRQTQFDHRVHVVNVAMGIKEPALYYRCSHDPVHRDAAISGIRSLMQHHGQAHGMFSGDEWLAGTDPSQGVELCAVVEYMYSLEQLIQVFADGRFGDILERVAFNALPATISADWHGHQYDQQVNQIMCTLAERIWTENGDDANLFGLEPNFGCCTANMHQGWPKFAARLWMATADGGLAAVSYAPCQVTTQVADGVSMTLTVDAQYPFRDCIRIQIQVAKPVVFPLKLRLPSWCKHPCLQVNGEICTPNVHLGYVTLEREWHTGDSVQLDLPMEIQFQSRANLATSVQFGPLVFALPVKELWQKLRGEDPYADWEIYPGSPWNYGLSLQASKLAEVVLNEVTKQPFLAAQAPVQLIVKGKRVPTWRLEQNSAAPPPLGPVQTISAIEDITLVPYGAARLRIAEFPTVAERGRQA